MVGGAGSIGSFVVAAACALRVLAGRCRCLRLPPTAATMKITARSLVGRLAPFALLGYPRLTGRPSLVGPHTVSTIRTRIAGCEAQVLYPTDGKDGVATRYARNELPAGLAEYSRLPQILFTHLAVRRHPCIEGADPLTPDGVDIPSLSFLMAWAAVSKCIQVYAHRSRRWGT